MTDVQFCKNAFDNVNPAQWHITVDGETYKSKISPNCVESISFVCRAFDIQPYELDHNSDLIITPRTCYKFTKVILDRAAGQTPTETTLKQVMIIIFNMLLNRTGIIPLAIDKYCMNDFFAGYADAFHLILEYYKQRKTEINEKQAYELTNLAETIFRMLGNFTSSMDDPITRRMLNAFLFHLFNDQKDFLFEVYKVSNARQSHISSDGKLKTKQILDNYFKFLQRSDGYKTQDSDIVDAVATWLELKIVE